MVYDNIRNVLRLKKRTMKNIIISDQDNYENILNKLISWWKKSLHVLSDFDRTLTQAFSDGKYRASLISVLYEEGHLSKEYQKTAQWFAAKYRPIELDNAISIEDKKSAMEEWRTKHKLLLIKEWITKQNIYEAMKSQNINLREWSKNFFDILNKNNIPLIILSAGWLGTLSIEKYLENQKTLSKNIHLIWNEFIRDWDNAIDFKRPIIHTFNKDETIIQAFPEIYEQVKNKKNVILLWDSLSDVKMIDGFEYDNLLKIWFLNKDVDKNIDKYINNYDVVITNDWNMEFINWLLEKIIK